MGWADALQGAGAWLQGNGPQYMQAQALQEEERRKAVITDSLMAESMIKNGRPDMALQLFESRIESGKKLPPSQALGGHFGDSTAIRDMLKAGDVNGALAQLSTANRIFRDAGLIAGAETANSQKGQTFPMLDPATGQMVLVGSVFDPRSGQWAAQQVPLNGEIVGPSGVAPSQRPQQKYAETSAQEAARLGYEQPRAAAAAQGRANVEAATAPKIAADTTAAQEEAKANVERKIAQRGNATAFDAYQQAMNGIRTSFGKTDTGPIAGRMPAVTAGQQTAEGAIAAAAPVLKQLFRSAGEGVFTDRDQQLLIDMLPKRTDHPEVVESKLGMIDSVVAAKLNMSGAPAAQPVPRETPRRRSTDQQAPAAIKFLGFE